MRYRQDIDAEKQQQLEHVSLHQGTQTQRMPKAGHRFGRLDEALHVVLGDVLILGRLVARGVVLAVPELVHLYRLFSSISCALACVGA